MEQGAAMTDVKKNLSPLKGRAREIFLDLCVQIDRLPPGSPLPSIRELQKKYTAGQNTVTKAIKYLAASRSISHSPRKRTRLSPSSAKPILPEDTDYAIRHERSIRGTTLGLIRQLRDIWEPVVTHFNQTHHDKVSIRYAETLEELVSFALNAEADFLLFHTHPVISEVLPDTQAFVSMTSLSNSLDRELYYPSAFLQDVSGRLWGIAPTIAIPTLFYNTRYAEPPEKNLSWDEFLLCIQTIARKNPNLEYAFSFDGYMHYLFNSGVQLVNPKTRKVQFNAAEFEKPLLLLKKITAGRLTPLVSESFYSNYGRSGFLEEKIAVCQRGYSTFQIFRQALPSCVPHPFPFAGNCMTSSAAEFFSICMHSLNYETAWKFIAFVLSPDIQRKIPHAGHSMPSLRNLRPEGMDEHCFKLFEEYINRTGSRPEDYLFPLGARLILEAGIDRWLRFGGDMREMLGDLERSCSQNIELNRKQEI